jgi:hypothetical protein
MERESQLHATTAYTLVGWTPWVQFAAEICVCYHIQIGLGTSQPPIQGVQGKLSLVVKHPNDHHSPSTSTDV